MELETYDTTPEKPKAEVQEVKDFPPKPEESKLKDVGKTMARGATKIGAAVGKGAWNFLKDRFDPEKIAERNERQAKALNAQAKVSEARARKAIADAKVRKLNPPPALFGNPFSNPVTSEKKKKSKDEQDYDSPWGF